MDAAASIDFLSSIPTDVLQESGRYGQVYDLQLTVDRAQDRLDDLRADLYAMIDQEERAAHGGGLMGSLTPAHERVERHPDVVTARRELEILSSAVRQAQDEVGGIVFLPACDNLPKIEKQLKALNRKAGAIGTGAITLTVTDEALVLNYKANDEDTRSSDFAHVFAVLSGATPQIPGYEFLARVIPTEHGNIVNKIPAIRYGMRHNLNDANAEGELNSEDSAAGRALAEIDLSRFVHTGDACEHCRKQRDRKDLYVVYNAETGETLQVGRTCLRDYMGSNDPERVLSALEQYREIMGHMASHGARPVLRTLTFLTHCATIMRKDGRYVKGLGSDAVHNHWNMVNEKTYKGEKLWIDPIPADEQAAQAMLRWTREEWEETGEFPTKVKIALAGESVDERLYNIAGAVFAARERWLGNADKRASKAERDAELAKRTFVGEVKQRITLTLTVTNIKWSPGYVYNSEKPTLTFTDEAGNRLVWFASDLPAIADRDQSLGPVIGGTYEVTATVVEHEDHPTFGKSTKINRAKFTKTINEPAESKEDDE